jgi:transcriptional regulator with XRE-family HTH domain
LVAILAAKFLFLAVALRLFTEALGLQLGFKVCDMSQSTIFSSPDYRDMLRAELASRQNRNPNYSLRSFARDLGLSAPRLSDVLRGRYGLSRSAAAAIADRLHLDPAAAEHLCDLVEASHGRSRYSRANARARLHERQNSEPMQNFKIQLPAGTSPQVLLSELQAWLEASPDRRASAIEIAVRPLPVDQTQGEKT